MEKTFENGKYYTSGKKVLTYFCVNSILPIIIGFIIIYFGLDYLQKLIDLSKVLYISKIVIIITGIVCCIIAFFVALIKYESIKFMFDSFAFHIRKGFLTKSEISIPFKQIQSIRHSQSLNQKIIGIMNIVVETAVDNEFQGGASSKGFLPTLDSKIALAIEKELLSRSNPGATNSNLVNQTSVPPVEIPK
ncbi:MAG: PH domain-containing protein [Candidatus Paceibacterota bacterium]|jgi:uncharacterized membrane protein YdbT with pleckstrin-like domain